MPESRNWQGAIKVQPVRFIRGSRLNIVFGEINVPAAGDKPARTVTWGVQVSNEKSITVDGKNDIEVTVWPMLDETHVHISARGYGCAGRVARGAAEALRYIEDLHQALPGYFTAEVVEKELKSNSAENHPMIALLSSMFGAKVTPQDK